MKWTDVLKQEWEIRPCWSGIDCWCRKICTKSGYVTVDGAYMSKEVASYFVALHNARLRNKRGYYSRINNIYSKKFAKMWFLSNGYSKRKWRVIGCGVRGCLCRLICIQGQDDLVIVDASTLIEKEAKYFVKLHNSFLKEKKKANRIKK